MLNDECLYKKSSKRKGHEHLQLYVGAEMNCLSHLSNRNVLAPAPHMFYSNIKWHLWVEQPKKVNIC